MGDKQVGKFPMDINKKSKNNQPEKENNEMENEKSWLRQGIK